MSTSKAPPLPRVSTELMERARHALGAVLDVKQMRWDQDMLATYGHDESDTGDFPPDLVVFPESTEEVQAIFRVCQQAGVPVTPVAARTGKSGGSLPLQGGVSMTLERMNKVKSISVEDLTCVVEPGLNTGELMRAVEAKGLFYPPDPNSWEMCSIGGNVAENAGGPRALKYGVTRDYVIGLQWVLPSGDVIRPGRQTIKGVAGYDLVGLFVGSEGTLGVATEITLQLIPLPRHVKTALLIFPSVVDAARGVSAVLAAGILPRTLELLDDVSVRAVDGRGFNFPPGTRAAVIAETDGNAEDATFAELAALGEVAQRHGAQEILVAQSEDQRQKLWAARRVVSTALRAMKPHKISEDICVPRSRIPEVIEKLKAMGEELGLTVATYGHAGDGNLHANILYEGPHERAKVDQAIERMLQLTVSVGGTITGEHGVGYAKRDYLPLEQAPELIALQKRIKHLLDPRGLLNPGKMFPA
ncbi:MAG TPA: FAD-linked oxidase C-terminal domain-containing protein [Myxococcales bacterium]|nr:FAD-linked oxidase C-terminal domain-containing protein [Myxococcales bacterium]